MDQTYLDPENEEELQNYTVLAQSPAAGADMITMEDAEGNWINHSYSEIVLIVGKSGDDTSNLPQLKSITPSTDRCIQYIKDYTGRNLAMVGYTSLGGDQYDYCGEEGRIKLMLRLEDGNFVDPSSADLRNYYVVGQSVEPNTEVELFFTTDEDGYDDLTGQTIDVIELTVAVSDAGQAIIEAEAAKEEELRASGALRELYEGTYAVGTDLEAGNYEFSLVSTSCSLNVYDNERKLQNREGDWDYLYGNGDKSYHTLRDGMYLVITSGAAKAIRTELPSTGSEMELFAGTFKIGTDLEAGSYEFSLISDSCSVNVYDNEEKLLNKEGDWDYLYGKGDKSYHTLRDGMYLLISSGATKVTRSDLPSGSDMELFAGVYTVGTDIESGNYAFTLISDSCSLMLYDNEEKFKAEEGDWSYLYGKGDQEFMMLKDGMILEVSSGAVDAERR